MGKKYVSIGKFKDYLWRNDSVRVLYNLKSIWKGYKLEKKICNPLDKTTHYWIQPWHLGDTLGVLQWIRPLKLYYSAQDSVPLIEKVVVITTHSNAAVAELYEDVDDIIVKKTDEVDALYRWLRSGIFIHDTTMHTANNSVSYPMSVVRGGVTKFGFTSHGFDIVMAKGYESEKGKPRIKFETRRLMMEYMTENDIKPEKTVILFPYSRSVDEFSINFWEKVSHYLDERGYCMLTNCAPNENEIKGTKKIDFLIDKVAALASFGCKVIGVQSGGMDVVASVVSNPQSIFIIPPKNDIQGRGHIVFAQQRGAYGPSGTITHKENVTYMYFEHETEDKIFDALCKEIESNWDNGGCDES